MKSLPEKQSQILDFLLNHPQGATLEEISEYLGITKSGTKEHLLKVLAMGHVSFFDVRGGVGRPKRSYVLTPSGHEVFPRQYAWLSNVMLEVLSRDIGAVGMAKLMRSLAAEVAGSMKARFEKHLAKSSLFTELTEALNELGYRARLKQSDIRKGAVIEATNCVYHTVAKRHPTLCRFDIFFLENASGMNVKLESCIARGGSVCRFCIKRK